MSVGTGTRTRTTSGGRYYGTAVELRADAAQARASYPAALVRVQDYLRTGDAALPEALLHAAALVAQAVGYELAAALCCVAQATEDSL